MSLWARLKDLVAGGAGTRKGPPLSPEAYFADDSVWRSVRSSNVDAVAYYLDVRRGANSGVLGVRFNSGAVYRYDGVSLSVYQDMMAADSKGRFVHREIKGRYPYRRIN